MTFVQKIHVFNVDEIDYWQIHTAPRESLDKKNHFYVLGGVSGVFRVEKKIEIEFRPLQ